MLCSPCPFGSCPLGFVFSQILLTRIPGDARDLVISFLRCVLFVEPFDAQFLINAYRPRPSVPAVSPSPVPFSVPVASTTCEEAAFLKGLVRSRIFWQWTRATDMQLDYEARKLRSQ